MYKISIDLGYGYVKGINEEGKQIIFPSVVGPGSSRDLSKALGEDDTGLDKLHVEIDGEEYFVGELAMEEAAKLSTATMEHDKTYHQNTRVLLAVATSLLLPDSSYKTYHLATGLPLINYVNQRDSFEEMLRNYRAEIKHISGPLKGKSFEVKFSQVTIFPQAAGVLYTGNLLQELREHGQLTAIVDVGYRTTDFLTFSIKKNGVLNIRNDLSNTINIGMEQVMKKLQDEFRKRTDGKRISAARTLMLLERKKVTYKGKILDFTDFIENTIKETANSIVDLVKNTWNDEADFISMVYLAGGSAIAMYPYLKNIHETAKLVHDAQLANAKGFLKFATIMERVSQEAEIKKSS